MSGSRVTYWAVKAGLQGPQIYQSWEEAQPNVEGFCGAWFRSFKTLELAQTWLDQPQSAAIQVQPPSSNVSGAYPSPRTPTRTQAGPSRASTSSRSYVKRESPDPPVIDLTNDPDTPPRKSLKRERDLMSPSPSSEDRKPISIKSEIKAESPAPPTSRLRHSSPAWPSDIVSVSSGSPSPEPEPETEPPAPAQKVTLSPEQQRVLDAVLAGKSLFFTGSAGTGKSVLLREIIVRLREVNKVVAVTASTGIASINIGGSTLHSFAGLGLAKGKKEELGANVMGRGKLRQRWQETDVLIIDEVSMIDGMIFDKFEYVARCARGNQKPFGGLQLVLCGDFFQLPPVPEHHQGLNLPILYAFEAESWPKCVPRMVTLTQVFRQKEQTFIDMLNNMRMGSLTPEACQQFYALSREVNYPDGLRPTELYPTRKEVDQANAKRMSELPLPEVTYTARDFPGYNIRGEKLSQKETTESLDRLIASKQLTLRVGAQVMLITNLVQGRLVNGSIGLVTDFMTVKAANEAYIEVAKMDNLGRKPVNDLKVETRGQDVQPKQESSDASNAPRWPVVQFSNGSKICCPPSPFDVINALGQTEASRDQVPLIMAWAMSIHKSQGQTLSRVKVDLNRIFEKGQAYVAISRATSLASLQIINFKPARVQAHLRVLEWHSSLGEVAEDEEMTVQQDDVDDW